MLDLKNKKIVVTGGAGFLGSFVLERLKARGRHEIFVPRSKDFDLKEKEAILRLYQMIKPHIVIHLAAVVGGIGANRLNPGKFFYDNAIMGIQLMECARQFGVEKFVAAGTICAYPKYTPVPFREDDLWMGYPEETNAPYGLAKKMMLVQSQSYRAQYNFNSIFLLPVNLYGPRDNFNLESSHVIPALIRKFLEAQARHEGSVTLWGDGSPTREFLYVEDCAEALVRATESYDKSDPVNLGAGFEILIRDLAALIARLTGFKGEIIWDKSQPNGQPRRMLDTSRALKEFGWKATTSFEEGLGKTISWYRNQTKTAS